MIAAHNMLALNANRLTGEVDKKRRKSTEKLSSGYRINRAADDAAGLAISEKIRSRIRGLDQAAKNIQDGISFANVADGALDEAANIMQRQNQLLIQAANGTNSSSDREAIEEELMQLSTELDRIFDTTKFNERFAFCGTGVMDTPKTWTEVAAGDWTEAIQPPVIEGPTTVWMTKGTTPVPDTKVTTQTDITHSSAFEDYDIDNTSKDGIWSYVEREIEKDITTTTVTETTVTKEYAEAGADYTELRKPGDMVGENGYINVSTAKGDLNLSCAMSQLGVKVDGQLISYDLYKSGLHKETDLSADKNTAKTVFTIGPNLYLTQKIDLKNDDTYEISYTLKNDDPTVSHSCDVRLAFDVMNTATTSVNDGSTSAFQLESDFASIGITASGVTDAALGEIDELYNIWDDSNVTDGDSISYHTGVGYWWENKTINPGASLDLGTVAYGPIALKKDPYLQTITTQDVIKKQQSVKNKITQCTYDADSFPIQAGAETEEYIHIPVFRLTTRALKADTPGHISAFSAESSIDNISKGLTRISAIRAIYGALTNRMESAYNNNTNVSENLQAAESRIRDTNMSDEMIKYSAQNILSQSSQAMLAQCNHHTEGVLNLLQ